MNAVWQFFFFCWLKIIAYSGSMLNFQLMDPRLDLHHHLEYIGDCVGFHVIYAYIDRIRKAFPLVWKANWTVIFSCHMLCLDIICWFKPTLVLGLLWFLECWHFRLRVLFHSHFVWSGSQGKWRTWYVLKRNSPSCQVIVYRIDNVAYFQIFGCHQVLAGSLVYKNVKISPKKMEDN